MFPLQLEQIVSTHFATGVVASIKVVGVEFDAKPLLSSRQTFNLVLAVMSS